MPNNASTWKARIFWYSEIVKSCGSTCNRSAENRAVQPSPGLNSDTSAKSSLMLLSVGHYSPGRAAWCTKEVPCSSGPATMTRIVTIIAMATNVPIT